MSNTIRLTQYSNLQRKFKQARNSSSLAREYNRHTRPHALIHNITDVKDVPNYQHHTAIPLGIVWPGWMTGSQSPKTASLTLIFGARWLAGRSFLGDTIGLWVSVDETAKPF